MAQLEALRIGKRLVPVMYVYFHNVWYWLIFCCRCFESRRVLSEKSKGTKGTESCWTKTVDTNWNSSCNRLCLNRNRKRDTNNWSWRNSTLSIDEVDIKIQGEITDMPESSEEIIVEIENTSVSNKKKERKEGRKM